MYAPFQNQKHLKEIDQILSEAEADGRKRPKAKGRTLEWLLIAVVIALVVTAVTRVAVWLARVL